MSILPELEKSEGKIKERLAQAMAQRKDLEMRFHAAVRIAEHKLQEVAAEMQEIKLKLKPYLENGQKKDAASTRLATKYGELVKDRRHLMRTIDSANEGIAEGHFNEIGAQSDGAARYKSHV
jgi:septal ring factor EnvC (AmiA/AmiB activator)